jgi:hypothetical protein
MGKTAEQKMMTFYCAIFQFYDNETVKAGVIGMVCNEKPQNSYRKLPQMDVHNDWFDTVEAASVCFTQTKENLEIGRLFEPIKPENCLAENGIFYSP